MNPLEKPGNQIKNSLFKNVDLSNLGRSHLEGNKDRLLGNIKLDLSMIGYSNKFVLNCNMLNTDTLNFDENKFVCEKNYPRRKRFSEILRRKHARNGRSDEGSGTTS